MNNVECAKCKVNLNRKTYLSIFVQLHILVKGDEMVKRYSQQSKWLFFLDKILESYLI